MKLVESLMNKYPLVENLIYLDADIRCNTKSLTNIVETFEYLIFRSYYESKFERELVQIAKEEYSIENLSLWEKLDLIKEFLSFFFEDGIEKALES